MTFLRIIVDVTFDAFNNIVYIIKNNLVNFANFLNFILPYCMYLIGNNMENNNEIKVGFACLIPIVCFIVIYYVRSAANKLGKGITVPIPDKRFTEVSDEGEVSIEHNRLQELLLYTADLEDWLERKGFL